MKDYLQAYLQAALEEERIEDERFREAVERRAREIAQKLERPYLEAMRLQALSKDYRAELTRRIAEGEGAEALLPLALKTISALCGDEAFAAHNLARLRGAGASEASEASGASGDPPGAPDGEEALRACERRELSQRADALRAFIADESVPGGEREQARRRLEEVRERLRLIGEGGGESEG